MTEKLLDSRCVGLALGLAFLLACFPAETRAAVVPSMPSGQRDLTPRQAKEAQVARLLAEPRVAEALASAGLTPDQVRSRLDRLSDAQLDEFAQNLETVRAGGFLFLLLPFIIVFAVAAVVISLVQDLFP